MKRFILHILLFFAIVVVVDWGVGKGFDYCLNHLKGGQYHSLEYAMKETKADVLVFGSSRAFNHYIPKVIEDSLGLTCYNCGYPAQGIIFQYGRLRYILNRYKPKLVIYDVEYHFDFGEGENERYLDMLKPYCSDSCIANYFKKFSWKEYIKNYSCLYRYNSNFVDLLKDYINGRQSNENGFVPLKGTMNYDVDRVDIPSRTVDTVKMSYLRLFIEDCQRSNVALLFTVSPRYDALSSQVHEPAKKLCEEMKVPYYDFFTDSYFQNHKELFHDSKHMNEEGAQEYTKQIVRIIRQMY